MDLLQAVSLGVVQGITEFLPISSTAHLILLPWLAGWKDPGLTFDVALHAGTFLAVAWYFWSDLQAMAIAWLRSFRHRDFANDPDQRLAWLILLGTIPAGIAGLVLDDLVSTTFRSPYIIAGTLIGVALLLALVEFVGKRERDVKQLRLWDAVAIGLAQACALVPGTSRSGATMTMAMALGLTREAAARFSFLLGVPIIFASLLFKAKDYFKDFATQHAHLHGSALMGEFGHHLMSSPRALPFLIGVVVSTGVGYLAIRFLLSYLQKHGMWIFIYYRVAMGAIILALIMSGKLPATMHLD